MKCGTKGPASDKWIVKNARFYRFQDGGAPLCTCTRCHIMPKDHGSRETRYSKLHFDDATVTKRVRDD